MPVEQEIEPPLEHIDELILGGMNMGRHRCSVWKRSVPGKRILGHLFRHVGLAENVPADPVNTGTGLGDACGQWLHRRASCSSLRQGNTKQKGSRNNGVEPCSPD